MCKDKINFCKTIRFTLFLSSLKILKYQNQKQENFIILRRIAIYERFHKWQFLFAYNCYLQIGFSSHPLVKPIMNIGMLGYEAKRFFISCLTVLSGQIALHKYRRHDITLKARLRWCSVKSESIQFPYGGWCWSVSWKISYTIFLNGVRWYFSRQKLLPTNLKALGQNTNRIHWQFSTSTEIDSTGFCTFWKEFQM